MKSMEDGGNCATVQGHGTPVPASIGNAKAGSPASSSYDRSAAMVGDLAIVASNATRLTTAEVMQNLGSKIKQLLSFIRTKNNVHGKIRSFACEIQLYFEKLETAALPIETADGHTQTKEVSPPRKNAVKSEGTVTTPSLTSDKRKNIANKKKIAQPNAPVVHHNADHPQRSNTVQRGEHQEELWQEVRKLRGELHHVDLLTYFPIQLPMR